MAALIFIILLGLFTFLLCEPVPPPLNLCVQAVNTNFSLHWSWAGPDTHSATFTVHYIGKFRLRKKSNNTKWNTACEETSAMFCDLNPLNLHYLGIYTLRVRAAVHGQHSQWEQVDFAPAQDAAVGPPTRVQVSPVGADLAVSISEPLTNNNTSMKDKINSLYYRFQYWERHADDRISQSPPVDSLSTVVVLDGLKPWTWYCVSVQSRTTEPNRTSAFTKPVCIRTQGGFQWGKFSWIFGSSLCLLLGIGLAVLLGWFYCKRSFQKSLIKPVFINELWSFPALLLTSDLQSEQCDRLTVKSSTEHGNPRFRFDWSSSSDSQDSGVYTNSSKSTPQQSAQSPSQESQSQQSQSQQSQSQQSPSQQSQSQQRTKMVSEWSMETQPCGQDLQSSVQTKDLVAQCEEAELFRQLNVQL